MTHRHGHRWQDCFNMGLCVEQMLPKVNKYTTIAQQMGFKNKAQARNTTLVALGRVALEMLEFMEQNQEQPK